MQSFRSIDLWKIAVDINQYNKICSDCHHIILGTKRFSTAIYQRSVKSPIGLAHMYRMKTECYDIAK